MSRKTKCKYCGATCYWLQDSLQKWVLVDPDSVTYDQAVQGDRLITNTGKVLVVNKGISIPNLKGNVLHYGRCTESKKKGSNGSGRKTL